MSSKVSSSPVSAGTHAGNRRQFALVELATVLAATLANILVYYIGSALVTYDPQFIVLADVSAAVIFTVIPAIVAVLIYAVLRRISQHPARVFAIIAAVVFVVTLIPDFLYIPTVPGATGAQIAVLALMHVVAAAVIVGMLTSLAHNRARRVALREHRRTSVAA